MFLAASAIRALLGSGLVLHGTFVEQLASGSVLASALNNLPAAAAVRAVGSTGRWAAILAMAVGPNLFITGSVATLICRRIARDGGAAMSVWRFTAMGLALVPLQLAAASLGLRVAGALR
jgi:Na+/H+ antiporter NhaD/arsenite permease-like protein